MSEDFQDTRFGGSDYTPDRDKARMAGAMNKVFDIMAHEPDEWWTLEDLANASEVPQSSVGSYLCYLRRDFGYEVPKRYISGGLYEYKLGPKLRDGLMPSKKKCLKELAEWFIELVEESVQSDGAAPIMLLPMDVQRVRSLAKDAGLVDKD